MRERVEIVEMNAAYFNAQNYLTTENQIVFIYADPNNIDALPLSERVLSTIPDTGIILATLGCNASGVKRLPKKDRDKWMNAIKRVADSCGNAQHDLHLYAINNDPSRWAYLLRTPKAWSLEFANTVRKIGEKHLSDGITCLSLRQLANSLIYTNAELSNGN